MNSNKFVKSVSVILSIILAMCAFGAGFTATAAAASPITYAAQNGGWQITACDPNATGEIIIPAEVDGAPVQSIAHFAFANCTKITKVSLPDTITTIGNYVFLSDTALTEVTLPASLKSCGIGIFNACTKLDNVIIPATLVTVPESMFDGCTSLKNVSFAAGSVNNQIAKNAFKGTAITKLTVPATTYVFGQGAIPAGTTLYCSKDSAAYSWAKANSYSYVLTDTFYVIFVADGAEITRIPFDYLHGLPAVVIPQVPSKSGYVGAWEPFVYNEEDIVVNAIYTVRTNTAAFVADGVVVAEVPFTIEDASINEPDVPAKAGYAGRWASYTIGGNSMEINAIYSPIESDAVFLVESREVGRVIYNTHTEFIVVPDIPEKDGYFGTWEAFDLVEGGVTVNAIYHEIKANSINITASANTVKYGETVKLTARILPYNALNQKVVWTSSDESVVTVRADEEDSRIAYVTNVGAGEATITVTVLDSNGQPTSIVGTLTLNADGFSIADIIGNSIQAFFAKVVNFINAIASMGLFSNRT